MRIRWRRVGRAAAIVVVGLIGLRLVPGLLRAPEPPVPAADVGLPKTRPATVRLATSDPAGPRRRAARQRPRRRARVRPVADEAAATAVIGSRRRPPRAKRPHLRHDEVVESTPRSVPRYVPPPPPEPASEPLPAPAPAPPPTPGDGSEEFAPH